MLKEVHYQMLNSQIGATGGTSSPHDKFWPVTLTIHAASQQPDHTHTLFMFTSGNYDINMWNCEHLLQLCLHKYNNSIQASDLMPGQQTLPTTRTQELFFLLIVPLTPPVLVSSYSILSHKTKLLLLTRSHKSASWH